MTPAGPASSASDDRPLWVAGADAFRDGWMVVLRRPETGEVRRRTVSNLEALLALSEEPTVVGLDMIVGLPDRAQPGGRRCDREARDLLGTPRSRSVFSPPAHDALSATNYEEAQRRTRASGPDAPGLSRQTYHLFPRLRTVADQVTPALQDRIREVHPELSFYAMNDDTPLAESKHTDEGRAARVDLLGAHGFSDVEAAIETLSSGSLGADDVLDAHAACWTARRIHSGMAERCPPRDETAPRNSRGLRMEIWR